MHSVIQFLDACLSNLVFKSPLTLVIPDPADARMVLDHLRQHRAEIIPDCTILDWRTFSEDPGSAAGAGLKSSTSSTVMAVNYFQHAGNPFADAEQLLSMLKEDGELVAVDLFTDAKAGWQFSAENYWQVFGRLRSRAVFQHGHPEHPHALFAVASRRLMRPERIQRIWSAMAAGDVRQSLSYDQKQLLARLTIAHQDLAARYFSELFEKTKTRDKVKGHIDTPSPDHGVFISGGLEVIGWVWCARAFEKLEIYCDDRPLGRPDYGLPRDDVAKALGHVEGSLNSGFSLKLPALSIEQGLHRLQLAVTFPNGEHCRFHPVPFYYLPAPAAPFDLYNSIPLAVREAREMVPATPSGDGGMRPADRLGLTGQTNMKKAGAAKAKPRVVLIHPPFTANPDKPTVHDRVVIHGLGLISSYARRRGHDFTLVDNRLINDWTSFQRRIADLNPDIVGIGSMTIDYDMAKKCIAIVKEVRPGAKIICGGTHPSLAVKEVAANPDIDHVVIGDGEITFVDLVEALADGDRPRRIIHGEKPVLDDMPFVDRDIFQVNEHLMPPIWFGESPWVSMITSRGCMFNCAFCAPASRIMFGRTVRRRSPANVIDELKVLRDKYAFKFLRFYDDNIIENEKWTREFCRLFKENDFSATFGIAGRADLICRHEGLMALLAQTGMIEMNIGFESGSQRVLDFLNKRTTVQQNLQAADILKKFGIKVIVSVMFGIPGETRHDILKTVELLDKTNPDWVDPAFLSPYPGSAIHEYCSHKGLTIVQESRAYERSLGSAPKIRGADYDFAIDALGHRYGNRANWPDSAAEPDSAIE